MARAHREQGDTEDEIREVKILTAQSLSHCRTLTSELGQRKNFILFIFLKILFIYLLMRDTETGAETQAEGEAGSMQGARRGTRSPVSRIRPWAEGGAKPLSHPGCPKEEF